MSRYNAKSSLDKTGGSRVTLPSQRVPAPTSLREERFDEPPSKERLLPPETSEPPLDDDPESMSASSLQGHACRSLCWCRRQKPAKAHQRRQERKLRVSAMTWPTSVKWLLTRRETPAAGNTPDTANASGKMACELTTMQLGPRTYRLHQPLARCIGFIVSSPHLAHGTEDLLGCLVI